MTDVMWREIEAQPQAMRTLTPQLRAAISRFALQPKRVLAGGCGDSYFGAYALREVFAQSAIAYTAVTAQQLASYTHFLPDDLVVLISISGGTKRTVEAARAAQQAGAQTLAVTCNPDSALAKSCHNTLALPYEPISRKTPHTLDYTVSLLALVLIAEHVANERYEHLESLPDVMQEVISKTSKVATDAVQQIDEHTKYFFLGAGASRGTAMYGAAKFHEAGGLLGFHEETENFVHGMNYMLEPDDFVFLIAPLDSAMFRAQELVEGLERLGVRVVSVSESSINAQFHIELPQVSAELLPFLSCLGSQVFCYTVANQLGLSLEQARAGRSRGTLHLAVQKDWMQNTHIQ